MSKKLINFGQNDPVRKMLESIKEKLHIEIHADGVKEIPASECPFCDEPCKQPHCPYTEKE